MGKTQAKKYVVTEKELNTIAEIAAEKAIDTYKNEHKLAEKTRQTKVLNSAKTLIINYRRFKEMAANAVYDNHTTTDEELKEILELMQLNFRNKDFEILSIKEKTLRTRMIIDHVDTMLEVYRNQCMLAPEPEESRRYRVIKGLYLDEVPKSIAEIAEEENIDKRTVFRDRDTAYKRLAILFFGIDGLRM